MNRLSRINPDLPGLSPLDFESFLAGLKVKDRLNVDRHLLTCAAHTGDEHAALWQRMACTLASLAPAGAQTLGQQIIQFFIPDGPRYRRQVFALEDHRDGRLFLYAPDVIDQARREGILADPHWNNGRVQAFEVVDAPGQALHIEVLTAQNTLDPPTSCRHMLGWNRRAMRIALLTTSTPAQIKTAETLCILAAREWK